ncbi:hypothetical protein EOK75_19470 (plasmid) [Pseudorhodobacter turbinis]|uniref:Uncharacterized protein n=1 Tax=Pseudorhodobacter turbinis TaxID=2500533 RepID=A0A4P8ELA4_9RHOB|nr:hypothetical protein [Pseudorhodobacter turbinis]QCO57838.1 hypothetical protein EOK75_19470 [Pseudorhodobacter turbinis]
MNKPSQLLLQKLRTPTVFEREHSMLDSQLRGCVECLDLSDNCTNKKFWLLTNGGFESINDPKWEINSENSVMSALNMLHGQVALNGISSLLELCVDHVVIFRSTARNSFYHPQLPRVIFINIEQQSGPYHILEELVHQAGHATVDSISRNCSLYVDARTASSFSVDHHDRTPEEMGTVVRFHSFVTLSLVCETLSLLEKPKDASNAALMTGRLSYAFHKLAYDLQFFIGAMELLKKDGLLFFRGSFELYNSILRTHENRISECEMRDQPYVFNEEIFLGHNALML